MDEEGDPAELKSDLEKYLQKLKDDFAFIAACNVGGEYMAPEKLERVGENCQPNLGKAF